MQNMNINNLISNKLSTSIDLEKIGDAQGIDWRAITSHPRAYIRYFMDSRVKNYFNRLKKKPKYQISSVQAKNYLAKAKRFIPNNSIDNYHFQLHHNFIAVTPRDFIYPLEDGLELFNTENLKKTKLISKGNVTCVDHLNDFVACAHDGEYVSIVNLNFPNKIVKNLSLTLDQKLINHVKFMNDPISGIKIVAAGNDNQVKTFDLEAGDKVIHSVEVDSYVNHFSFNKNDQTMIALAYDATEIDIYDFKSNKKILRLLGHEDFSFGCDWHDNGYILATANQDLSTRIWDIRMGKCLEVLPASNNSVSSVRFVSNSKFLIIGEFVSYLNFYQTNNWRLHSEIDYFGSLVGFDAVGKDEDTLFVGVKKYYGDLPGGIIEIHLNK